VIVIEEAISSGMRRRHRSENREPLNKTPRHDRHSLHKAASASLFRSIFSGKLLEGICHNRRVDSLWLWTLAVDDLFRSRTDNPPAGTGWQSHPAYPWKLLQDKELAPNWLLRAPAVVSRILDQAGRAVSISPGAVRIGCEGLRHGRRLGGTPLITTWRPRIPS
jgi:hypothetical protein